MKGFFCFLAKGLELLCSHQVHACFPGECQDDTGDKDHEAIFCV